MFRNYLKLTLRAYFSKRARTRTFFTYINLIGLIIGLASFLIIIHLVRYELSYDNFYPNASNIYRIKVEKLEQAQMTLQSAKSYPGVGAILKAEIPQIENYARVLAEECMLHYKEKDVKFNRQKTFWADGSFPYLFGLEFLEKGEVSKLSEPYTSIISKSLANRFFGTDWSGANSPIGKTIWLNEGLGFVVVGVFQDLPSNAHMKVDFVVSYSTLVSLIGPSLETGMPPFRNINYTYISLKPDAAKQDVEALAQQVLNKKIPETASVNVTYNFGFQPVQSIHLDSHLVDELQPGGNKIFVVAMTLAAALILVVAWINFINLTTARAMDRAKEVGVRKAVGSSGNQLISQFIFEALFSTGLAAVGAVILVFIASRYAENLPELKPLTSLWGKESVNLWFLFVIIIFTGGLLASIYPALVLSSFRPIEVLKGKVIGTGGKGHFRKALIGFQFFFAVLLLSCTGAIYYQVDHMRKQTLGLDMDRVLVIHTPRSMIGNKERISIFKGFREQLLNYPAMEKVGSSGCLPGEEFLYHREGVRQAGKEDDKNISFDLASVDEGYIPTLAFKIVDGRNFSDIEGESNKVIPNETAIRILGFKNSADAIGKFIHVGDQKEFQIIGVVGDAHYEGLQHPIRPLLLLYGHDYEFGFFSVKVDASNVIEVVSTVKKHWDEIYPNDPFDYFFLDSFFDEQYKNDQSFGKVFGFFSSLAILIACLGLIGLVSFTTFQKTKEIGIRKVLGASFSNIIGLLTSQFSKPILLACVVAIPVTYFMVNTWLNTFAYRFEIQWWMYVVPLMLINAVATVAIGWQAIQAALANPVKALKEE